MNRFALKYLFMLLLPALVLSGCGKDEEPAHPVSGTLGSYNLSGTVTEVAEVACGKPQFSSFYQIIATTLIQGQTETLYISFPDDQAPTPGAYKLVPGHTSPLHGQASLYLKKLAPEPDEQYRSVSGTLVISNHNGAQVAAFSDVVLHDGLNSVTAVLSGKIACSPVLSQVQHTFGNSFGMLDSVYQATSVNCYTDPASGYYYVDALGANSNEVMVILSGQPAFDSTYQIVNLLNTNVLGPGQAGVFSYNSGTHIEYGSTDGELTAIVRNGKVRVNFSYLHLQDVDGPATALAFGSFACE